MSNLFSTGGAGNVGASGITQQSLKFNDDESQYLSWTPAAAGNRKTWTWSGWVKRGNLVVNSSLFSAAGNYYDLRFTDSDTLLFYGNGSDLNFQTITVYRDPSAWYHVVVALDTTQSTALDRVKIYVNGEQQTSFSSSVSALNAELAYNNTVAHAIGRRESTSNLYADSYLSDIHFIDGQALDPTSFGQFTNGYWKAKDYAGSYGTNGFHLTFEDDVVSEGFNAATWKGNSPLSQSISGLGFSPDLVWIKSRSQTYNHVLADTVRGQGKDLYSNTTGAESSSSTELISFDADGFSVGAGGSANDPTGSLGFVAWAWDAGSGSPVSNTDGSITSTVKANPDYGFSIASFTGASTQGATFGHGLGVAPNVVIAKARTGAQNWWVYHSSLGYTKNTVLNLTNASATDNNTWLADPTSSLVTIGDNFTSSNNYIAYCFAEVAGYSSIGSYSGNGSASGPTVTTGFEPAWIMIKRTDGANNWVILDTTRDPDGQLTKYLVADYTQSESDSTQVQTQVDATGFTLKSGFDIVNASGGTYIYMAFADTREAAFWKDVSGQGNHWQPNNLDYRDSLIDSPANNFATLNPLVAPSGRTATSEGNLTVVGTSSVESGNEYATIGVSSGKWYWENAIITNSSASTYPNLGAVQVLQGNSNGGYIGSSITSGFGIFPSGPVYKEGSLITTTTSFAAGDIVGIALNLDDLEATFYKNGTLIYTLTSLTAGTYWAGVSSYYNSKNSINFGQDSTFSGATTAGGNTDDNGIGDFAYAPPSGYLALCTANLPTPTIVDGSEHFNTVLYTGNSSTQSITGVGFQPDFVWVKARNQTYSHRLQDVVRGSTKGLSSESTSAESTVATGMTSFDSDGFSLGSGTSELNNSAGNYAAWNWKAGGTAVSNTDGSITSQVSANVDAGFSVVSWSGNTTSGATVGHGLGVAPDVIIFKRRDGTTDWHTYHSSIPNGNTYLAYLNTTAVPASAGSFLNSTYPSSSVITLGGSAGTNGSSMIAYCFANTDGYLKAGSYTGNGSSDGPFVYTGGKVQWLMIKRTDSARNWVIVDNARDPDNEVLLTLEANVSDAEYVNSNVLDFLSNGFKPRSSGPSWNTSGGSYIYLAIMSTPQKHSNAR